MISVMLGCFGFIVQIVRNMFQEMLGNHESFLENVPNIDSKRKSEMALEVAGGCQRLL